MKLHYVRKGSCTKLYNNIYTCYYYTMPRTSSSSRTKINERLPSLYKTRLYNCTSPPGNTSARKSPVMHWINVIRVYLVLDGNASPRLQARVAQLHLSPKREGSPMQSSPGNEDLDG